MKISIITSVLNNKSGMIRALESLFSQTFRDYELIVIDGGSTDGTVEYIQTLGEKVHQYISEKDHGIYDALNKGLALASGDVVGFLHSDDLLADPWVLEKIAVAFAETDAEGVYGDLHYVSNNDPGQIIRHWKSNPFTQALLRKGWMPPHPSFYIKRKWYTAYGNFDTRYTIAGDYDLMLRFLKQPGFIAVYLPEVLVKMSVGGISNRSLRSIWKKSMEDLEIIKNHQLGGWGTLLRKNFSKVNQFFSRGKNIN